jgi:hypothetical protein
MNIKLAFLAILLLIGLTLSGCVGWGGYGYNPGYGYGHYGYPYGHSYYNYGYPYRHHQRDWDDHHHR